MPQKRTAQRTPKTRRGGRRATSQASEFTEQEPRAAKQGRGRPRAEKAEPQRPRARANRRERKAG